jgi:paraquat-inducible protein B
MAVEKSYARLGFFTVVTVIVVLATAVFFVQRLRSRASIPMVTYLPENVSGLDVSSPVRYRGVPVGRVTDLRIGASFNTIEIDFEVFVDRLSDVGLDAGQIRTIRDIRGVFPRLRAQIVNNPISGEGYLLLDSPINPPPAIELGFEPTKPYVPSMPSLSSRVQDRLPAVLDRADATLETLKDIVARIPASLDRSDRFFTNVERIMRDSQLPELSADSRKFFAATNTQIEQMRSNMDQVIGTEGTLVKFSEEARTAIKDANLPATARSTREAEDSSRAAADDIRRSLPAIQDSLEQLRELARQLQEQPESVVYGPRPEQVKPK